MSGPSLRTFPAARGALGVALIAALASGNLSCGAPPPPPPGPVGLAWALTPSLEANTVRFSWTDHGVASGYVVEVGSSSGQADLGHFAAPSTSYSWAAAPAGKVFYARVRAIRPGGASPPSNEVSVASVDLHDVIDALWFGSGPLAPQVGYTYCVSNVWLSFPAGATVRVRVSSTTVPFGAQEAVQQAVQQASALTGASGARPTFELTAEPDPQPAENEITVITDPDPVLRGCPWARGCTIVRVRNGFTIVNSRAILGPTMTDATSAYAHDGIGHGFFGYCHIDSSAIGGARYSLMSGGPSARSCDAPSNVCDATTLTTLDSEAARAVYGAGVRPGSSRQDFIAAGLIRGPRVAARGGESTATRYRVSETDELILVEVH